jgi:hypothetical protein
MQGLFISNLLIFWQINKHFDDLIYQRYVTNMQPFLQTIVGKGFAQTQ